MESWCYNAIPPQQRCSLTHGSSLLVSELAKKKKQSRVLGALRSVCSSTGQALDAAAMPDFGSAWASQVLQSHKTCDSACRNQSTKVYL